MDVSNSALAAVSNQMTGDAVGMSVLKKALSVQAQGAVALVNAVPKAVASAPNLPSHLGQNVNTTA
jgi:hypothetical protein